MKSVTAAFLRAIRDGVGTFTSIRVNGSTTGLRDISSRILSISDLEEAVETIEGDLDGGDVVMTLDNRDGYFVGDGTATGLLEAITNESWQVFLVDTVESLDESIVSWAGLLESNWRRRQMGTVLEVRAISYVGHARNVAAWDGDTDNRILRNIAADRLIEDYLLPRLQTHAAAHALDFSIRDIAGDSETFQAFDSLIDDAGQRTAGPGRIVQLGTSGDVTSFFLFTRNNNRGFTLTYDDAAGNWTSATLHPHVFDSAVGEDGYALPADSGRFWVQASSAGTLYLMDPANNDPRDAILSVSALPNTTLTVQSTRSNAYVAEIVGSTVRVRQTVGGASFTTEMSQSYSGLTAEATTVTRDGAWCAVFDDDKCQVFDVSSGSSATLTYPASVNLSGCDEFRLIENSTGDWGVVGWRTSTGVYTGVLIQDNGASLPTTAAGLASQLGGLFEDEDLTLGPTDLAGLLAADDPENTTGTDETIGTFAGITIDDDYRGFSVLLTGDKGFATRNFIIGSTAAASNYRASLVSSTLSFDDSLIMPGIVASGLSNGPVVIQPVKVTLSGGTERIYVMTRTDQPVPVIHEVDLFEKKVYDVLADTLAAVNAHGYFRWDDANSRLELVVRSRGAAFGALSGPLPRIHDTEDGFSRGDVYDGVEVTTALGARFTAGDTTSPNSRVLTVSRPLASPAAGQALADDLDTTFGSDRRPITVEVDDAPHIELLDSFEGYVRGDNREATFIVTGKRRELETGRMVIEGVASV